MRTEAFIRCIAANGNKQTKQQAMAAYMACCFLFCLKGVRTANWNWALRQTGIGRSKQVSDAGVFAAGVYSSLRVLPQSSLADVPSARESSSLEREPLGLLSCNNAERAAEKPVVPVASRDRSGERRTNKQRKNQEMVRPREAHAGSTTPSKDYYVGAGGVQRGWQSMAGSLPPPLALFASFSGPRKKISH